MEMSEILSNLEKQAREVSAESNRTGKNPLECLIGRLNGIESELDNILSGKKKEEASAAPKADDKPKTSNNEVASLQAEISRLTEENQKIKEAATRVLDDFDKANTRLREVIEENNSLKERISNLQKSQVDAGTLTRQNNAMSKTIGEILGSIERCRKDL